MGKRKGWFDGKNNQLSKKQQAAAPINELPADILKYIFELTNSPLAKPTAIARVCKFWNELYSNSELGKFQKIILGVVKTLHQLPRQNAAESLIERILITAGIWLKTCQNEIIPNLELLAKENNTYALLLLYKLYCENQLIHLDPTLQRKISTTINDYKITLLTSNFNAAKGYMFLVRVAAKDKNSQEHLVKISNLILQNPQLEQLFNSDQQVMNLIKYYSQLKTNQEELVTQPNNLLEGRFRASATCTRTSGD